MRGSLNNLKVPITSCIYVISNCPEKKTHASNMAGIIAESY